MSAERRITATVNPNKAGINGMNKATGGTKKNAMSEPYATITPIAASTFAVTSTLAVERG